MKFAFPTFVLPTNRFGTQFQPSSDFKFGYLGNRGHTAGTVSLCLVRTEAIKAHQLGLREALNVDSFNFQPGTYLFILLPQQQNELLNHSAHRLGQLFPCISRTLEAPAEPVAAQGPLLIVSPHWGSQAALILQPAGPGARAVVRHGSPCWRFLVFEQVHKATCGPAHRKRCTHVECRMLCNW